jgi:hypothetical protein
MFPGCLFRATKFLDRKGIVEEMKNYSVIMIFGSKENISFFPCHIMDVGGRPKWKRMGFFGKEIVHKRSDGWKEAHNACMQRKKQLEGRTTRTHGRKT